MRTLQDRTQLREEAIALRLAGKSVREIKDALGPVGKRTLSAALKGTPPAEWTRRPNPSCGGRGRRTDRPRATPRGFYCLLVRGSKEQAKPQAQPSGIH